MNQAYSQENKDGDIIAKKVDGRINPDNFVF